MRILFSVLFGVFLVGCSSLQSQEPYQTRLFRGTYEEVWAASLKALSDYPIKTSNKDTGKVNTETINGPYNELLFTYPEAIDLPERYRFSLKLNFAKLANSKDEGVTRVRVIKELEKFQDFYTGWGAYPADGLEEKLILYRIEHLLRMDQALNRTP